MGARPAAMHDVFLSIDGTAPVDRGCGERLRGIRDRLPPLHAHFGDPAPLDFEHLDRELVHLESLADVRHTAEMREQIAAKRLKSLALNLDAETIAYFINAHLAAEDERAVALVGDR